MWLFGLQILYLSRLFYCTLLDSKSGSEWLHSLFHVSSQKEVSKDVGGEVNFLKFQGSPELV